MAAVAMSEDVMPPLASRKRGRVCTRCVAAHTAASSVSMSAFRPAIHILRTAVRDGHIRHYAGWIRVRLLGRAGAVRGTRAANTDGADDGDQPRADAVAQLQAAGRALPRQQLAGGADERLAALTDRLVRCACRPGNLRRRYSFVPRAEQLRADVNARHPRSPGLHQVLDLGRGLRDIAPNHNQPAGSSPPGKQPQLSRLQRWDGPDRHARRHKAGGSAAQEAAARALCTQLPRRKHCQVGVARGVDHHHRALREGQQCVAHSARTAAADVSEGDVPDVARLHTPAGLLLHVVLEVAGTVAKGTVARKLGCGRGHQAVALLHVVHVVNGVASACQEEGAYNEGVKCAQY
mmetsp:Transcript_35765/g.89859  ORF Transcript_35765/g.89859 Transcript_35765/m.89859 type:complete len:349 (+) Transcript_35765:1044-2090(+)